MFSQLWKAIKTHSSQRYLQTAYHLRRCSWCFEQIFEDRECFPLQMKCMMSVSVEIIFYWAWLIISVWENEPKLKETTVNHFALRHYWWIEVYACSEHGNLVKQYARIVWASFISSLEVARYDCLPHRFSPTFQPPLFSVENWKKKQFLTRVWTGVIFENFFALATLVSCFMIVLWREINDVFLRFFLLFNSITSAVTACNVGVF